MAADEKPLSDWEESERVGPYQLHEQVQPSEDKPVALYRAVHESNGASALVLKLTEQDVEGSASPGEWQVLCVSSPSQRYLALEVRHSRWAAGSEELDVEALLCALDDLRAGVERMAHMAHSKRRPRQRKPERKAP